MKTIKETTATINDICADETCQVLATMEVSELEQRFEYDVYICNYTWIF